MEDFAVRMLVTFVVGVLALCIFCLIIDGSNDE
jgi:hypothetical protein